MLARGVIAARGGTAPTAPARRPLRVRLASITTLTGGSTFDDDPSILDTAKRSRIRVLHGKLFQLLDRPRSSRAAFVLQTVIIVATMSSVLTYMLSTNERVNGLGVQSVDFMCNVIFTLELAMRLFVISLDCRNAWTDLSLYIDVLSLSPFYLDLYYTARDGSELGMSDSVPRAVTLFGLLRLLRVLKLLRHYSGWRVLIHAIKHSARPVFVPMFAMLVTTLVLGGLLQYIDEDVFPDAFEAMWLIFWLVTTLDNGSQYEATDNVWTRLVQATAIVAGLLLTTMPITIIGNAFAGAWAKREMIEVALRVREHLEERGLKPKDVVQVFSEYDKDGSGDLDFTEFHAAMNQLHNDMPIEKMKRLFCMFDGDNEGTVNRAEFCGFICPALVHHTDTSIKSFEEQGDEQGDASEASSAHRQAAARAPLAPSMTSRATAVGAAAEAPPQASLMLGEQQRWLQNEEEQEGQSVEAKEVFARVRDDSGAAAAAPKATTATRTLCLSGDPDAVRKIEIALRSMVGLRSADVTLNVKTRRRTRRTKTYISV